MLELAGAVAGLLLITLVYRWSRWALGGLRALSTTTQVVIASVLWLAVAVAGWLVQYRWMRASPSTDFRRGSVSRMTELSVAQATARAAEAFVRLS